MLVDKWVDVRSTFKKLEETVHVDARHFPEDSTYDSFNWFLSKHFSKIWVAKLGVWVICVCVLCAGVYGNIGVQWYLWQTFFYRGEKWEFCPLCFLGGLLMLKELLCPSKMLTLNLSTAGRYFWCQTIASSTSYYMATSLMKRNQILCCDWLPERARWSSLAHSVLPAMFHKLNFSRKLYNKINPLLTNLVWSRWLNIGPILFCKFMDLD